MTAFVGWAIIVMVFCALGLALLWPVYRLVRRSRPGSAALAWIYVTAGAGCGLLAWYVIPLAVHGLFGRAVP